MGEAYHLSALSEYMRLLAQDDLPRPIHEARIFSSILNVLPVDIKADDVLAGSVRDDWQLLHVTDELAETIDNMDSAVLAAAETGVPSSAELLSAHFHCFGGYTAAHTTIDYPKVIDIGFEGIIDKIQHEHIWADVDERAQLEAMVIALNAVGDWAKRYAELAEEQLLTCRVDEQQTRLKRISETCCHVPMKPARTFHEALQSIWFCHVATGISEYHTASLSLGRLDKYLFNLYMQDMVVGVDESEMAESLEDLFKKLNSFGDPACAVNVGGVSSAGMDAYNPLSELIIEVVRDLRQPSPILAAHIHPDISDRIINQLVDPELFTIGQPSFYGEYSCQEALKKRGVAKDQVHKWTVNSCMGLMMPGEEISDMWGSVVNMLLPLELATNNGKPYHKSLPIPLAGHSGDSFENIEELIRTLFLYAEEILEYCVNLNREAIHLQGTQRPNPFLSAMISDCIERGLDRLCGGAKYHTVVVEAFGLVNAADAMVAIDELVFKKKRYTLAEMVKAAKHGFARHDQIYKDICEAPKYGNGDDIADSMAVRFAIEFSQMVDRYSDGNLCYMPSFHTLTGHIDAGAKYGASLDGRKPGEPIAKNVGTTPRRCKEGLTSLLLSAASLPQMFFYGGQALDISIDPKIIKTKEGKRKFMKLLQTYFSLGGLQIQVNGVGPELLKEAMRDPQAHSDLIVRIAGYSTHFINLPEKIQKDMVERFSQGL